jgi:hypothetical protein
MTCRESTGCWATGAAARPARPASAWPRVGSRRTTAWTSAASKTLRAGRTDVRDALPGQIVDQGVVVAVGQVVVVLHAHHVGRLWFRPDVSGSREGVEPSTRNCHCPVIGFGGVPLAQQLPAVERAALGKEKRKVWHAKCKEVLGGRNPSRRRKQL